MAGKTPTFENDILKLIFNNVAIAGIGDAAGLLASAVAGSFYMTLHTGDPDAGNQATAETTYTGYGTTRIALARSAGAWTVTGNSVSPASTVNFNQCTAGGPFTITHVGIGTNATVGNAGKLLFSGALSPSIIVQSGVTPQLTTATTITES